MTRVRIGHVAIDGLTFPAALEAIRALVRAGEGGSVFTPNVDHVVLADHDERFRRAYESATLSLVDGTPVLWASRLLGTPLPEKVSGSDLLLPTLELAAREGWRVYLLGGTAASAARAVERLRERLPALDVVGTDSASIDMDAPPSSRADVLHRVRASRADLVVVALGSPKQELWIGENHEALRPSVLMGLGASVDFLAGTVRRAPGWMSRLGMEWLFRLVQEPRRMWRRYLLRDPYFLLVLLRTVGERVQGR